MKATCKTFPRIEDEELLTSKLGKRLLDHSLHLSSFSSCAVRRQAVVLDRTTSTASGWQHVVFIKDTTLQLWGIQISDVIVSLLVPIMSLCDYRIEEFPKHFITLFVPSYNTNCSYEWVSRVVYSCLDGLVECVASRSFLKDNVFFKREILF